MTRSIMTNTLSRGPKKGSGSVIAKLRDEHELGMGQETGLPPFDLSQLEMQIPTLGHGLANDSPLGTPLDSPLGSPLGSQFGDAFAPTSDPSSVPRSVPLSFQNGISMGSGGEPVFAQAGVQLPSSWQMPGAELLQFQPPPSASGYLSISDLAQQIFQDPSMVSASPIPGGALAPTSSRVTTPLSISRPSSIDAYLTSSDPNSPPTATTGNSPVPVHGPKFLYRSDSSSSPIDPRLSALAAEVSISSMLISQCVKQYFRHLYPISPVIHEPSFQFRMSSNEELTIDEKVLVLSICAITVLHAGPQSDLALEKKLQLGKQFLDLCFQMRRNGDWTELSNLTTIIASYHICICLFELKKPRGHHFYLREAIGMAHEQGLHLESTYVGMDEIQSICSRRTYALLFITERGCAILRNKFTSITKLPYLPSDYFDEHDRLVSAGFSSLVNLFSILDEKFVTLWQSNPVEDVSAEPLDNIAAIQHSLNELAYDESILTDIQRADVSITHQWLRLVFWQASMRQGLVSSSASDPVFYYDYPITIAKDLCEVMNGLTFDAILVHGLGIFEKIFEIAYTLMDALTIAERNWSESEELRNLFSCLSASPSSHNTYVKILENKMDNERSPMHSLDGNMVS